MPKTDPTYQVSRDALMKHFARGLNYDDDLVAGIYSVKENSLQLGCKFNDLSHYHLLCRRQKYVAYYVQSSEVCAPKHN